MLARAAPPPLLSAKRSAAAAFAAASRSALAARAAPSVVVPDRRHSGYIPFTGRLGPAATEESLFIRQMGLVDLKPVKKMTFTFDPIRKDVRSLRQWMHHMTAEKRKKTNVKCIFRFEVVSDRSEPTVKVELNEAEGGGTILFKSANLSQLELVSEFNKMVLPLVKEEEQPTGMVTTKATKLQKKGR